MRDFVTFVLVIFLFYAILSFAFWSVGLFLLRSKKKRLSMFGFELYAQSTIAKPSNVAKHCPCTDEACKSCRYWTCSKYPYRKEDEKNEKQS